MRNIVVLENGTREEACKRFDEIRKSINDFRVETVSMSGNIRNINEGWSVVKTYFK